MYKCCFESSKLTIKNEENKVVIEWAVESAFGRILCDIFNANQDLMASLT